MSTELQKKLSGFTNRALVKLLVVSTTVERPTVVSTRLASKKHLDNANIKLLKKIITRYDYVTMGRASVEFNQDYINDVVYLYQVLGIGVLREIFPDMDKYTVARLKERGQNIENNISNELNDLVFALRTFKKDIVVSTFKRTIICNPSFFQDIAEGSETKVDLFCRDYIDRLETASDKIKNVYMKDKLYNTLYNRLKKPYSRYIVYKQNYSNYPKFTALSVTYLNTLETICKDIETITDVNVDVDDTLRYIKEKGINHMIDVISRYLKRVFVVDVLQVGLCAKWSAANSALSRYHAKGTNLDKITDALTNVEFIKLYKIALNIQRIENGKCCKRD
jgi:hypothetical protein